MKLSKERRLSMDNLNRRMLFHYLTLDEIPKSAIEVTPGWVNGSEIDSIYVPNCKFIEESGYTIRIRINGDFNQGFNIAYNKTVAETMMVFNYRNSVYLYYYLFPTVMRDNNAYIMYGFENVSQYVKIPLKGQYNNVYAGGANTAYNTVYPYTIIEAFGSRGSQVNTWTNTDTPMYVELVA